MAHIINLKQWHVVLGLYAKCPKEVVWRFRLLADQWGKISDFGFRISDFGLKITKYKGKTNLEIRNLLRSLFWSN